LASRIEPTNIHSPAQQEISKAGTTFAPLTKSTFKGGALAQAGERAYTAEAATRTAPVQWNRWGKDTAATMQPGRGAAKHRKGGSVCRVLDRRATTTSETSALGERKPGTMSDNSSIPRCAIYPAGRRRRGRINGNESLNRRRPWTSIGTGVPVQAPIVKAKAGARQRPTLTTTVSFFHMYVNAS
jgi:hypothetical protein